MQVNHDIARHAVKSAGFGTIYEKAAHGKRLTRDEGLALFESGDLLALGYLANTAKKLRVGDSAFYIYNQHLNYSNVCINGCAFCAFGKPEGHPDAFRLSVAEAVEKVAERRDEPIRELHIVGGLDPGLPFSYYVELIGELKKARPRAHIKAFTAVEIAHMAHISRSSTREVLAELKAAGLGSLPGGGAEVFSPRVRKKLCPKKLSAEGWLRVHREAHEIGLSTNATILYGHIETIEERIDHLIALRELQDETGGFMALIPLAFHPENTRLSHIAPATGFDHLKTIAISRLMLDNFPHIKAYWVMLSTKLAQVALAFGADDLDGTIMEEKITHMAGGRSEQSQTRDGLRRLIRAVGLTPVERDTFYNRVD